MSGTTPTFGDPDFPPWDWAPGLPPTSAAWRQGGTESLFDRWKDGFRALCEADQHAYVDRFAAPAMWRRWLDELRAMGLWGSDRTLPFYRPSAPMKALSTGAGPSALAILLADLRRDGKPSEAWLAKWSARGDPFATVWRDGADAWTLRDLLHLLQHPAETEANQIVAEVEQGFAEVPTASKRVKRLFERPLTLDDYLRALGNRLV